MVRLPGCGARRRNALGAEWIGGSGVVSKYDNGSHGEHGSEEEKAKFVGHNFILGGKMKQVLSGVAAIAAGAVIAAFWALVMSGGMR